MTLVFSYVYCSFAKQSDLLIIWIQIIKLAYFYNLLLESSLGGNLQLNRMWWHLKSSNNKPNCLNWASACYPYLFFKASPISFCGKTGCEAEVVLKINQVVQYHKTDMKYILSLLQLIMCHSGRLECHLRWIPLQLIQKTAQNFNMFLLQMVEWMNGYSCHHHGLLLHWRFFTC